MSGDKKTGLCLKADIPTTMEHGADGLPLWAYYEDPKPISAEHPTDESGYHHGDSLAMMLATHFRLYGFALPQFDLWLGSLEPCGAKTELLERRSAAVVAATAKNKDGMLRHLEWMARRRFEIAREDVLLPMAKKHDEFLKERKKPRSGHRLNLDAWLDTLPDLNLPHEKIFSMIPGNGSDESEDYRIYAERKDLVGLVYDLDRPDAKPVQYNPEMDSGFHKSIRRARKRRGENAVRS